MWFPKLKAALLLFILFGLTSCEARLCHVTVSVDENGCSIGDNGGGTTDMRLTVEIYDNGKLAYKNEQLRTNRSDEEQKKCFDGDNWCYQFFYTGQDQTAGMNFYVSNGMFGTFYLNPSVSGWNNGGCWARYYTYVYSPFNC